MINVLRHITERPALIFLLGAHIVLCCVSLAMIAPHHYQFHIYYDLVRLNGAVAIVAAFSVAAYVFTIAPFSFGYLIGFNFYTTIIGYLWLNHFSDLDYDHRLGALSAAVSAIAFLAPALFITSPVRQIYLIPPRAFDRVLVFILLLGAATIAVSSLYGFKVVSLDDIYDFRGELKRPLLLNYLIGIASNALLPFAFGCFVIRRNYWRAAIAVVLLLMFYPITLSKLTFFAPVLLLTIAILSSFFTARLTIIIALFVPMLAGAVLVCLFGKPALPLFDLINFRMVAVPSIALDIYNDFFSTHGLTYFCQIGFLKHLMACPYREQLSVVMEKAYDLGTYNASLFATEGIASVGTLFAPIAVFACGLAIALANRLSAGLPPRLVLISGAVMPQVLLNVPLTTAALSHGAALLVLLWYLAPRSMFERQEAGLAAAHGGGQNGAAWAVSR